MICKFFLYISMSFMLVAAARSAYIQEYETTTQLVCGEGEEIGNCPTCDPTCEVPYPNCSEICPVEPRCVCKLYHVRVGPNKCILLKECYYPPTCSTGQGEGLMLCADPCEDYCSGPPPASCAKLICLNPKCQCLVGYLRNENGFCVPRHLCPPLLPTTTIPSCGPGEEYRECGTVCEGKCSEPEPDFCPDVCLSPRCQCMDGYARIDSNLTNVYGECVPRCECPPITTPASTTTILPTCPPNEVWHKCFTNCNEQCNGEPYPGCDKVCNENPGCQCIPGYARGDMGVCIPRSECPPPPPTCPTGEFWAQCATPCKRLCWEPESQDMICYKTCTYPQCQCYTGHARNGSGVCIPRDQCSQITYSTTYAPPCLEGEQFNECSTACEEKCSEPPVTNCTDKHCLPPSCQCIPGFARRGDMNNFCVPREDCPTLSSTTTTIQTTIPTCPPGESYINSDFCDVNCNGEESLDWCQSPACRCQPFYRRNDSGVCIPFLECPRIPPLTTTTT